MPTRGISATSRTDLARVVSRGKRVLTVDDASEALGLSRVDAAKRLARWAEQGWLRRVRRGLYIPVPVDADEPDRWTEDPLVLADVVWGPCFFTGWTAANHWSLTEQVFRTTVVKTSTRVRRSSARLLEHEYLLLHTDVTEPWGLETVWRGERRLRFADAARTVIDVLDDPRIGGGIRHVSEIVARYLDDYESGLLLEYGDRAGNATVFKRLGHIIERLGIREPSLVEACSARLSSGLPLLDPSAPPDGHRDNRWRLRANVTLALRDSS